MPEFRHVALVAKHDGVLHIWVREPCNTPFPAAVKATPLLVLFKRSCAATLVVVVPAEYLVVRGDTSRIRGGRGAGILVLTAHDMPAAPAAPRRRRARAARSGIAE